MVRLILAARRKEKLQALADDLQQRYRVETLLLPLEVQNPQAVSLAILIPTTDQSTVSMVHRRTE